MTNRRRAAFAGTAVVLGALALTGCEKPTPLVTVVSGSDSITVEAKCYNKTITSENSTKCTPEKPKTFAVKPGSTFGIGVEGDVADKWQVLVGSRETSVIEDRTFFNGLPVPLDAFESEKELQVRVIKLGGDGDIKGLWTVNLVKA
ncbi:hypothetical protein [Yinghuangia soli]|uniref:Lipoprotein n=1 Tax=Yinghuangia soli TaxID=2908204 RepID=A0AA41Q1X8_9ACTN|nr:hypothetical protein [Yinghuangia soli]MCF2529430.1 hypothetical protein [Yinghuangia soli]